MANTKEACKLWPQKQGSRYTDSVRTNLRLALNLISYLLDSMRKMDSRSKLDSAVDASPGAYSKLDFAVNASASAYEECLKLFERLSIEKFLKPSGTGAIENEQASTRFSGPIS